MPLIRVVTWNIRHARRDDGVVDLDTVAATLGSLDADVVAVQEVDRNVSRSEGLDQAAILADHLGMRLAFAPAIELGGGTYGHGLLTRRATTDLELVELPGRAGDERRVALLATAQLATAPLATAPLATGGSVSVAALHLQPRGRHDVRRAVAVDQLRAALDHLTARPSPRLLLGDLNVDAPAATPMLRAAGLHLVETPPTHPAVRPRRALDVVAVSGFTAVDVEVPAIGRSDHRPVIVDLEPADFETADLEPETDPEAGSP